jgi:penicillin G amidase
VAVPMCVLNTFEMPGLSNRNPVAGYGNIGQVHIRYKPKPPPKSKYGVFIFLFCLLLFLFSYSWTDPWRRYVFAIGPLRFAVKYVDTLRYYFMQPSPPLTNFSVSLDSFGHPLIAGDSLPDVVFGQGYIHAKEHFFQMDYLRQRAFGNGSQYEGEARLSSDLFVRALGLSGHAETDLLAQDTEELALLQQYADGVNFYLRQSHPLPLEYAALGISVVEEWQPLHSLGVLRYFALQFSHSWETELSRKLIAQCLKKDSSSWVGSDSRSEPSPDSSPDTPTASASWGWVLSGKQTSSGKPILSAHHNHETSSLPLFVQNTLMATSESFQVAGSSLPGVPLVLMGRTKEAAWTILPAPTDEPSSFLTVETLRMDSDCAEPTLCRWSSRTEDGSWVPAQVKTHELWSRSSHKLSTSFNLSMSLMTSVHTQRGLVLTPQLFPGQFSAAMSGKGQVGEGEGGVAEYLTMRPPVDPAVRIKLSAFINLNRAQNWSQFSEALSSSVLPFDWQFLFADSSGNIARLVTGQRSVRLPLPPLWSDTLSVDRRS